jgi:hypothetical protein
MQSSEDPTEGKLTSQLLDLTHGYRVTQAIYTAADLGLVS